MTFIGLVCYFGVLFCVTVCGYITVVILAHFYHQTLFLLGVSKKGLSLKTKFLGRLDAVFSLCSIGDQDCVSKSTVLLST